MKISAYIRTNKKLSAEQPQRVCFRVRDGKTDIKVASDLMIAPASWDAERFSYLKSAKVCKTEREDFNGKVKKTLQRIEAEYQSGVDTFWLKHLVENVLNPSQSVDGHESLQADCITTERSWQGIFMRFVDEHCRSKSLRNQYRSLLKQLERYERYKQLVVGEPTYIIMWSRFGGNELDLFIDYCANEASIANSNLDFYQEYLDKRLIRKGTSKNSLANKLSEMRNFLLWCEKQGIFKDNSWRRVEIGCQVFGSPIFLTLEERDRLYDADLRDKSQLAMVRDIFVFQCLVGCRWSDLIRLTRDNMKDGFLEYIPVKTINKHGKVVRVPLADKALSILYKYETDLPTLFPFHYRGLFMPSLRELFKCVGINRMVTFIDPQTRTENQMPISELASSHMARRTFVGNLYAKVKDQSLVSALSGHSEDSKSFARYRTITDEMKTELIQLLDNESFITIKNENNESYSIYPPDIGEEQLNG